MAEKKYAKYVLPAPIMRVQHEGKNAPGYNFASVYAHKGELESGHSLGFHYITKPYSEVYPHTHAGNEILCFVGGDPENIYDFDAEIELLLGEEGESHVITTPSVFNLPAGLIHGPLNFIKVNKPVFFLEVTLTPVGNYEIIPENKEG